jgi:poly(A) polymerase/tRNA nucleotidyltransferase (CCA-adding enzyme)
MFHYNTEWTDSAVRRFVRTIGTENLDDLFAARRADTLGNGLRRSAASAELTELRRRIVGIIEKDTAFSVRDLDVDGESLKQTLGIGEGPAIGRILDALLEEVLEDPARNERSRLLARAGEILPEIEASLPPRRKRRES